MQREELYHKTVDILVQAYFNDTLKHGDCYCCAVGNLVCSAMGYRQVSHGWMTQNNEDVRYPAYEGWAKVFISNFFGLQEVVPDNYHGVAKTQIDSTGYSWQELAMIEKAFEMAESGYEDDEWMFNGLMAVIEALDEIHENKDPEVSTKSKNRFAKV